MAKAKEIPFGLPAGMQIYSSFPFAGLNLSSGRTAMRDQEFYDLENWVKIGDGNLRTLGDVGPALYTATGNLTIISAFFYNIAITQYAVVFLSDGTAIQVNTTTGAQTVISSATGTFYNGGSLPGCIQWGSQYLIIGNNHNSNAYWVWDGSLLYTAGSLSPNVILTSSGGGYTSPPTVTAFGGVGSGATFQAIVQNGFVSEVFVTNPGTGYEVGDQVQLLFTGGGTDSGAELLAVLSGGELNSIVVTSGGTGYTVAPLVSIGAPPAGGTQATATATISGGTITGIALTNAGAGYTSAPVVTLNVGGGAVGTPTVSSGTGATATTTISGGSVTVVNLGAGGSGYTSIPLVTISGGGGTGATATATISGGAVTGFVLTSGGTGYTSAPTVAFSGGAVSSIAVTAGGAGYGGTPVVTISAPAAGGTQATATATESGGVITSITMTNIGSGYIGTPTVTITAPGNGGSAYAVIVAGSLSSIKIVNGGTGFSSTAPPTLTLTGGGGSGATATATVTSGVITTVTVTANGTGYTSAPAVVVQTGQNLAASGNVTLMPYGVSGTCLEDYVSRVWIGNAYTPPTNPTSQNNGNKFQVSAPESLADFSTSDGGVLFTSQDRFLRQQYVAMRQTNGYLYPIGDSSVAIVSGVNTTGNPATTTFNYQNTDPQVGTPWRDSCQDFGRTVVFANALGVYALYGGAITKVSRQLDPLFTNAQFPPVAGALTPTSAAANIYGGKYYLLLLTIVDPITQVAENKMIVWDEQNWSFASQSVNLQFICTQEVNSDLKAWGSDGKSLYPLFQTPSDTLVKKLSTKLYGANRPFLISEVYTVIVQGQNQQTPGGSIGAVFSVDTEAGSYAVTDAPTSYSLGNGYINGYPVLQNGLSNVSGIFLGLTMTTTNADMTLNYLGLTYTDEAFQLTSTGVTLNT